MIRLEKTRAAMAGALVAAVLAGCTAEAATTSSSDSTASTVSAEEVTASAGISVEDAVAANLSTHDDDADHAYQEAEVVEIALTGDSAEADSDAVTVSDDTVTITAAGTYRLSGSLAGQVVVDTEDDGVVRIVLDDAEIASSTTSALAFVDADIAMVVLAEGSTNTLADGSDYVVDGAEPNAALYSAADLTLTGAGALTVTGNANDGIASQDGLVLDSGTVTVEAVDDGIRGKDHLVVQDADVTVVSGGDGLKSDNAEDAAAGYVYVAGGSVSVTSGGDGLTAETDVIVGAGTVQVRAGGGSAEAVAEDTSAKGLKGTVSVVVGGGTVDVDSADDAVHSDGVVSIQDGTLTLATADDGVHADGDVTIAGGSLSVTGSYEAVESAVITIVGGQLDLTASDDGINVGGGDDGSGQQGPGGGGDSFASSSEYQLTIAGGTIVVDSGGDGLDSNGSGTMTGGTVTVSGPTEGGNGALDVQNGLVVSGGDLLVTGSSGMAQAPVTSSEQAWVAATFDSQDAGSTVQIVSADGTVLGSWVAGKAFALVTFSSADVESGAEYTVVVDGAEVATTTAGEFTGTGMGGGAPRGGGPRG
ncbi:MULTISPECIES: carbohydrate-binding domain-containing protein [unclassified Modestobacter]